MDALFVPVFIVLQQLFIMTCQVQFWKSHNREHDNNNVIGKIKHNHTMMAQYHARLYLTTQSMAVWPSENYTVQLQECSTDACFDNQIVRICDITIPLLYWSASTYVVVLDMSVGV